ncbi:MAG: DUF2065 domain-containing protein [Pseudomonadota bacterium]
MTDLIFGLGFVALVEGLLLALMPDWPHRLVRMLAEMPAEQIRMAGLAAMAFGVGLIWLARV